jgi:hypothetical protein
LRARQQGYGSALAFHLANALFQTACETGKNRGLRRLRIACFVHSWVPTRQRGAPVLVQNAGAYLQ